MRIARNGDFYEPKNDECLEKLEFLVTKKVMERIETCAGS